MPTSNALFFASSGNILAIILNYWLGYWLYDRSKKRLESSTIGLKSLEYGHNYGYFILPFSWLPLIGDPLTIVSGVLRLNFVWFVIVAGGFRLLRYYFLTFVEL